MQKTQIDQYDMLLAVENHFEDNTTLWTPNAPIEAAKTKLSSKIDEIADEVALQLINPTGITEDKTRLRNELESKGFILSAALSGFAAASGKSDMYKRVHLTKTQFLQYRESELLGVIGNLHKEATDILTDLTPFGVTSSTLTEIMGTCDDFRDIMKDPTAAVSKRKSATERISVLLPEALSLLETQMDNLIVSLSSTEPQFVSIYSSVRNINNTATNPLSLTINTLDSRTNAPIANATIEIVGEGITRVSGERGYNRIQNLTEGTHQLSVSHPNFISQTTPFTIVRGETTQLVISLESAVQNIPS